MISLSLDLQDADVEKLATLIDAALAAGADGSTPITVEGSTLRIEVASPSKQPQETKGDEPEVEQSIAVESPLGEAVRQVVTDEAVRGLVENLLGNKNNRRF
ncbi:hypothetical protein [Corynebacterium epidermidicanis]|uniref:Uncharacterized protein n=1 Tax=Corynebacterium epidermidicanis TaxID=1050174 RepID=A0A0G3GSN0_9CORY|nr:hypothetical protein [Corynebacterium epidermidicanis]AKK03590.1 hypothetical protein CEPID_08700 [Corynebacterium epidermidicanis]